ncbi:MULTISPECIES: FAD-dependent monooxygenase [unclassified Streptomyces]|uniref:FAD-dependent monooxygenase n=1 Tax=unclassified Streptomyces TaxID=2593676 RepID=UPI0036573278
MYSTPSTTSSPPESPSTPSTTATATSNSGPTNGDAEWRIQRNAAQPGLLGLFAGHSSDDLTRFSQFRLPRWHTRRIVLVGDAAHCIDPLSGLGAHATLLGASTLAQSLPAAGEDVTAAFAAYEARIRPFVQLSQRVTARRGQHGPGRLRGVDPGQDLGALVEGLETVREQRGLAEVALWAGSVAVCCLLFCLPLLTTMAVRGPPRKPVTVRRFWRPSPHHRGWSPAPRPRLGLQRLHLRRERGELK